MRTIPQPRRTGTGFPQPGSDWTARENMSTKNKTQTAVRISGLVTQVVDGNTFELKINGGEQARPTDLNSIEIIRIEGRQLPSPSTLTGILAKLDLEKRITGRTLECDILGRDSTNQLIASVPKHFFKSPFDLK